MKRWSVTSPSYTYTEPVLDDGSGPEFDTVSYAEVEAETRRQAKVIAVKVWRKQAGEYDWNGDLSYCDDGYFSPFKGLVVEEIHPCPRDGYNFEDCEEGVCIPYWCDKCQLPIDPLGSEILVEPAPPEAGGNLYAHQLCTLSEEDHAREVFGFDYI